MMKIINNSHCRMCRGTEFEEVINFGDTPLVNGLLTEEEFGTEEVKNLTVVQCQKCFLVQIKDVVDSEEIYRNVDYLYFSSDMPELSNYFKIFAQYVGRRFLTYGDSVAEIGSNDGILLQHLREYNVLGIDPAINVALRALKRGIPTLPLFFTYKLAQKIKNEYGQFQLIAGFNCIAHLNDLNDVMLGVKELLTPDGVFVVECNYWGDMVKNTNYALIYHDHFSYFTLKNWVDYANKNKLKVFDAITTPAQGGSLRVFMAHNREMTDRCQNLLRDEEKSNLNSYEVAQKYGKSAHRKAKRLGNLIRRLKADGYSIAGYGAAAKGFSVLKLAGLDEKQIDFFVDDSPAKQDKFTPISHIPIYARDNIEEPDYFLITAPNFKDVIIKKEREYLKNGGKFITINSEIIDG